MFQQVNLAFVDFIVISNYLLFNQIVANGNYQSVNGSNYLVLTIVDNQ